MYKIIGTDGKQYGPVSAEQLKNWIAQNRVERQTPVFVDGSQEWTFLGLLPEFAGNFGTPPPKIVPQNAARTNGFATAGIICGILSLACCCGLPFSVLGIVFSLVALSQIGNAPEVYEGRGLAIAGLILSAATLVLGFLFFFCSLISPNSHFVFHSGQF